ncbi:MAG: type II toxin-antitoxin system RelE/ParE family toxin [Verrucomicrobiota bacterium]
MASYSFHPEALEEYTQSTIHYLQNASARVAEAFASSVESAISEINIDPTFRGVVAEPEIRRYVFKRFPYVLYYRWQSDREFVTIFAIMHCSREPDYWKNRSL